MDMVPIVSEGLAAAGRRSMVAVHHLPFGPSHVESLPLKPNRVPPEVHCETVKRLTRHPTKPGPPARLRSVERQAAVLVGVAGLLAFLPVQLALNPR